MPWKIRPAIPDDVNAYGDALSDLIVDRWREGQNRRCLVAVDEDGRVVGCTRGVDNVFHPTSRVMTFQTLPGLVDADLDEALVRGQAAVSTLPLSMKIDQDDERQWEIARRLGAVVTNVCPPWQFRVDDDLRAWATAHAGATEPASTDDLDQMADVFCRHYVHQHETWSPPASVDVLRQAFAEEFTVGSDSLVDLSRSFVLKREGRIVAQALLWHEDEAPDGQMVRELGYEALPYEGPTYRQDLEAVIAAAILASPDGDILAIDSHATERVESAVMAGLPDPIDTAYTALVVLPVEGAAMRTSLDRSLLTGRLASALDMPL